MSQAPLAEDSTPIAGRYRLLRILGEGTFGSVYEADDLRAGERVALKLLRPASDRTAPENQALARFLQEAQVATQLQHPNIVRVRDIGEHADQRYLAMDLVQGLGLDRLIGAEGRLAAARAAAIVAQVADALGAAHAMGVVHRDIKPANILLAANDHVQLTDFGVAVLAWSAVSTEPRTLQGTPAYMSPEQARGLELDGRSDLFSLGLVLYEALSGARAFESDSITGLIFKVITESPPPIASRLPLVPAGLAAVVERALNKDPADRYENAERMAAELRAAV